MLDTDDLIDLQRRVLEAHRVPAEGAYAEVATYGTGDTLSLATAPELVVTLAGVFERRLKSYRRLTANPRMVALAACLPSNVASAAPSREATAMCSASGARRFKSNRASAISE